MSAKVLAPAAVQKFFDNNGLPLAFGFLTTLQAGTLTPQASYKDSVGTFNTNPIQLNARGECSLWLDPLLTYKFALTDAFGSQIPGWPVDNIPGGPLTVLTSDLLPTPTNTVNLGGPANTFANLYLGSSGLPLLDTTTGNILFYARTAAEVLAGVMPVNYFYPPLCVDRYQTNTTPGTTDMSVGWQHAIAVASVSGGTVTTIAGSTYLVNTALTISGGASIDGGSPFLSHIVGSGTLLYTTSNITLLTFAPGSNRCALRNINVLGNSTGASQIGVAVGGASQVPVDIENVGIFNFNVYGLDVISSFGSSFRNLYVQGCGSGNILTGAKTGANKWFNVSAVGSTAGFGFDFGADQTAGGGSDEGFGIVSEQNKYGIVFETNAAHYRLHGVHTEQNLTQSIWWKAGSNDNVLHGETVGSSEPVPLNQGGAQNAYVGPLTVSGSVVCVGSDRIIQRRFTNLTAQVTAGGLSAMAVGSLPANTQGLQILSQAILPVNTSSNLRIRARATAQIATTGQMIAALFGAGTSAIAATAIDVTGGKWADIDVECEISNPGGAGASETFTFRIGSSTGPDTVTAGPVGWNGIVMGSLTIEEIVPSTG